MKPNNKATDTAVPSVDELTGELNREKYHSRYKKLLRSTIYTLVIVAAISVLVATLLLPVLQIYGTSMNPNLHEGEIVVSVKSPQFKTGDIIAFYYNNRVLVKRIIGCPGDSVVITDSGDVYVNNTLLDEPYLTEKSYGTADIEYPYTVPQNSFFVLGDHRHSKRRYTCRECSSPRHPGPGACRQRPYHRRDPHHQRQCFRFRLL